MVRLTRVTVGYLRARREIGESRRVDRGRRDIPCIVDLAGLDLDFDDLSALQARRKRFSSDNGGKGGGGGGAHSVVDVGANYEPLLPAVDAVADGDDVAGLDNGQYSCVQYIVPANTTTAKKKKGTDSDELLGSGIVEENVGQGHGCLRTGVGGEGRMG